MAVELAALMGLAILPLFATGQKQWAFGPGIGPSHEPRGNLLGGNEIDHILHNSPTMVLSQYDTGACGLWLGMSDHQPVLASYSGIVAPGSPPRFTNVFSQARSLHLTSRFCSSAKQLKNIRLAANIRLASTPPGSAWKARLRLLRKRRLNFDI